jgi:hypothetical protein
MRWRFFAKLKLNPLRDRRRWDRRATPTRQSGLSGEERHRAAASRREERDQRSGTRTNSAACRQRMVAL